MEANETIKQNDDEDENVYNTSQAQVEAVLRSQQHFYPNDETEINVYNTSPDQVDAVLSSLQHLKVTLNRKDQTLEKTKSSEIKEQIHSCYEEVMPDLPTYSPTDKSRSADILITPFVRPPRNLLVAALILIILAMGITMSCVVLIVKWPSHDITGRITHIFLISCRNRRPY